MLIAQISDPHLRPRGILYQGVVDSNAMLATAIDQLNRMSPRPDVVILTGDVVDEGSPAEYREARDVLSRLVIPIIVIPGNHDEREAFRSCFGDHPYVATTGPMHFVVDQPYPVRMIGIDVTVPGEHHGLMDAATAAWLDDVLARDPDRPSMVMMHQPPFATHLPYLDAYWCREGERLAEIVRRYPAVERIVCGHVHRFMMVRFGGTSLCTAPSTTTAIALRFDAEAEPASFVEPPGFLLHHWSEESGLVTHLVPIGTFPGPYPFG